MVQDYHYAINNYMEPANCYAMLHLYHQQRHIKAISTSSQLLPHKQRPPTKHVLEQQHLVLQEQLDDHPITYHIECYDDNDDDDDYNDHDVDYNGHDDDYYDHHDDYNDHCDDYNDHDDDYYDHDDDDNDHDDDDNDHDNHDDHNHDDHDDDNDHDDYI